MPRLERAVTIRGMVAEINARSRADHRAPRNVAVGSPSGAPSGSARIAEGNEALAGAVVPCRVARGARGDDGAYRLFVAAFRGAAEALRLANRMVEFPEGSFPPGLPWVPEARPGPF